ncbi:hypothetical protein ACLB2K_057413 [Fragaria x ananassa]
MVPRGNAWLNSDGSFACQHETNKCLLNTIEACTTTIYPNVNRHFRFIHYVERLTLQNKHGKWADCFEMLKLGTVPIDCYNRGYGNQIETKYAKETTQLNPPHRFVSWLVVNNKPLAENNCTAFCQHRPDQCKLNSLQSCTIDVMHDVNKHFALIYCIEFLAIEGRQTEWETCFRSLRLPKKHILDCYNCSNATKLEQNYGNEIMHLNPPLEFVPWLVLNNQPIGNDYENFAGYVCKAYKCKIVPMTCQSVHLKQKTE